MKHFLLILFSCCAFIGSAQALSAYGTAAGAMAGTTDSAYVVPEEPAAAVNTALQHAQKASKQQAMASQLAVAVWHEVALGLPNAQSLGHLVFLTSQQHVLNIRSQGKKRVRLFDKAGKSVKDVTEYGTVRLNMGKVDPGRYMLLIQNGKGYSAQVVEVSHKHPTPQLAANTH